MALISLGCPKNLVDSEKMLGLLAEGGLVPTADEGDADAIVVNTCGFLAASKDESLAEIRRAAAAKADGRCRRLIVAGCLVQRHRAALLDWCPDIDAIIGVFDRDRILEAVRGGEQRDQPLTGPQPVYSSIAATAALAARHRGIEAAGYFESDRARLRLTPRHYAYLRVSEGCNQNCAFCTIPSIRGKMRSKPLDAIVAELHELTADGAFEINLIGQDTTSYGEDLGIEGGLVTLLATLDGAARQAGGAWLRLMYAYPSCFTDDMIDALADLPSVVKYVDMPLQHINDAVLDRMRRGTSRQQIERLLKRLRDRVPGIALRTTFISGFPGETDAQHGELVDFVRETGFDAMGVFPYSPEPNTPAGSMHQQGMAVPEDRVGERIEELMLTQQEVVFDRNHRLADQGANFDVLIDAGSPATEADEADEAPNYTPNYVGRTYQQAPQVDSVCHVSSRAPRSPGELLPCRIIAADNYDLVAVPREEEREGVSLPVVG